MGVGARLLGSRARALLRSLLIIAGCTMRRGTLSERVLLRRWMERLILPLIRLLCLFLVPGKRRKDALPGR